MQEGSAMVTPGYEQTESGGGVAMTQAGGGAEQQTAAGGGAAAGGGGGGGGGGAPAGFGPPDQAQFEADKRSVYKHPLFPLLALLFERCEQATQSAECPNSESFNMDIQAFVQHQERDRKPFLLNDPEVDGLMIKAIQVLRIHLLELEKVQELCKDFCNRYITCLKGKMQSENLLRSDYASYDSNNHSGSHSGSHSSSSNSNSPAAGGSAPYPPSPHPLQVVSSAGGVQLAAAAAAGTVLMPQHPQHVVAGGGGAATGPVPVPAHQQASAAAAAAAAAAAQLAYQMVHTPQGLVAAPVHLPPTSAVAVPPSQGPPLSPGVVHGSTPLSQIGANPCPPPSDASLLQGQLSPAPTTPGSVDDEDDYLGKKKQKRGVLPKHATSVMRSWLFQHLVHPYPTEDEKRQIAAQTNLTLLQVNNWFINARRRILQPMLDASAPGGGDSGVSGGASHRKAKSGGSTGASKQAAAQRFWPDNIASLQPQLTESNGTVHTDSSLMSSGALSSEESDGGSSQEEDEDDEDADGEMESCHGGAYRGSRGGVPSGAELKLECSSEDSQQSQQQ
ncbi:homeobox protein PKNOX1-like [Schistocerca cancellata]|uniref:homeobox protein PKNOX1-like n=1 Tax=Schistocerca cancellata TaxID=274614 RepID=UPI002119A053|nr:homeobox protein PKNOX1-like [Schistocerca cancellata]XP_049767128.1 homeobox protein PKNOX1-like [Schistocerca cancellata]